MLFSALGHVKLKQLRALGLAVMALGLAGCAGSIQRSPIKEADITLGAPFGIAGIRAWGDGLDPGTVAMVLTNEVARLRRKHADALAAGTPIRQTVLSLSGGGPDGAFGAGFLAGWQQRGDRPEFDVVTGVSTGAIIAMFALLGPEYDETLREIYTEYKTDQLLRPSLFSALFGGPAMTDSSGYNDLIDRYVDDAIVARLAAEHQRGRTLLIGTTNLDASRPVVWNVTKIAASGNPNAKALIRDLIRASSAIPAVFAPVVIPTVTADGQNVDELHVDGGATAQVMLFSPEFSIRRVDEQLGQPVERTLYIIMNNSLQKRYEPVEASVLPIAGRAVSSLIGGSGGGDLYKIFAIAQRDGLKFNAIWIPDSFDMAPTEAFDPVYMEALYKFGLEYATLGAPWRQTPPNFAVE